MSINRVPVEFSLSLIHCFFCNTLQCRYIILMNNQYCCLSRNMHMVPLTFQFLFRITFSFSTYCTAKMKAFVILWCCLVSNVVSVQENRSMKSSQNGKSSPLLWMIINKLDRLETTIIKIQDKTEARQITGINKRIDNIQKKNSVLNAKVLVLQTDVRKLKGQYI